MNKNYTPTKQDWADFIEWTAQQKELKNREIEKEKGQLNNDACRKNCK